MKNKSIPGVHAFRLNPKCENPREVAFAKQWEKENDQGNILAVLLTDADLPGERRHEVFKPSDRDYEVAATVIQWLGSNVGMCFLRDVALQSKDVRHYLKSAICS